MNDPTELIENNELIKAVYSDLAHPVAKIIGETLGTALEFIYLPVKHLSNKLKALLKKRLDEYVKKLEQIPDEKRCGVHPQIGRSIFDKLTYTTNDDIADLFTTLLAAASNSDLSETVHPAHISIIEQISPDEAKIIRLFKCKAEIEYCDINGVLPNGKGYKELIVHETNICNEVELNPATNVKTCLDNFVRLGILVDKTGIYHTDETGYDKIMENLDFEQMKTVFVPSVFKELKVKKGLYVVTDLGKQFISVCVK